MKRLIKFRGKRVNGGEWIESMTISYGTVERKTNCVFLEIAEGNWQGVLPETVGQFTGLLDKNGKEIYEGDILSANGKIIGYVVDGVRGYCYDVVYTPPLANGETSWSLYGVVVNDHPNEIEVSGNIFDNPELLKGGKQ